MKAIACASYDYMKVVVAELQKQVDELTGSNWLKVINIVNWLNIKMLSAELERLKKLGMMNASAAPAPVVSSRQRHNPFNIIDRENANTSSTKTVMKKQTFAELHALYGKEIVKAREQWLRRIQHLNSPLSNNLIIF